MRSRGLARLLAAASAALTLAGCYGSHDARAGGGGPDGPGWPGRGGDPGPAPGEGEGCPRLAPPLEGCASGDGICDPGALRRALRAARPGDVVRVGVCALEGPFEVPAGVTLAGAGPELSLVVSTSGPHALRLDGAAARARCLGVRVGAGAGVLAEGAAEVAVDRLVVRVERGVGLRVEDVGAFEAHGLRVEGPVTAATADAAPGEATPENSASHGLWLARVERARLSDLHVAGFAAAGVLLLQSATTVRGLDVEGVLGAGIAQVGGSLCARAARVDTVFQGVRLLPAYGVVAAEGASLRARELSIASSEGLGLLADASAVEIDGLALLGAEGGGLWIQRRSELTLRGAPARIEGTRFCGVFSCDASAITLEDAAVQGTEIATRLDGEVGTVEIGDGVAAMRTEHVALRRVRLADSARAQLLVDLGPLGDRGAALEDVVVSAAEDAYGAIPVASSADGAPLPEGWDRGVRREGSAEANDASVPWPVRPTAGGGASCLVRLPRPR